VATLASPSLSVLSRACSALAKADPEAALSELVAALSDLGLRPCDAAQTPVIDVQVSSRRVVLESRNGCDASLHGAARDLLHSALLRLAAQDQARGALERAQMLSAASFEGIFIHVDGVVLDANQRMTELSGYSHDELLGSETITRCVAPEDLPEVQRRVASKSEGVYLVNAVHRSGRRFRAELQSKQGRLGDCPVRVVAVRDVSERERTLALLHESEQRLRDLADAAFDAAVLSREGVIVDINGRAEDLFCRSRAEIIGHSIFEFVAPSSLQIARQAVTERRVGSYEAALIGPGGEPLPVEVVAAESTLNGEPVRVAGLRDRRAAQRLESERRELEQQVMRGQRLESVGVLAGGIAHDFNNLLVGVLGNAELLLQRLSDPFDRESAESIRAAGERAADLIKLMLAYAGQRDVVKREPVDLGGLLRELNQLLGATLSKKARIRLTVAPNSVVPGDRAMLTQVLMNLLTNASDALQDRVGTIEITTELVRQPDARWDDALGASVRPGEWLLIEVADTGSGMDEATRSRVFEPFFSTKETGHGLGLAACLGIVSAHGGAIHVASEPGKGSRFSMLLPAGGVSERAPRASTLPPRSSASRVLVVDDEAVVRSQVRRSLELRGYVVDEANGGESALAMFQRNGADVILLDMTMQDLDGAEVARRIRAGGSRVPIVLASGHLRAVVERELELEHVQGFLRKPYRIVDLVDAIERALAS
jgi:two-component system, cell cycle sensor histidine kinase and response regulator CckA